MIVYAYKHPRNTAIMTQEDRAKTMTRRDYKTRFRLAGEKPLAKRPIALRVPGEVEDVLFAMPPQVRNEWLRGVILEAAKRDLMHKCS